MVIDLQIILGKHLDPDDDCDLFDHSATAGPSLAFTQAILGRCLSVCCMAPPPRPKYCIYALHSFELQIISHPSRQRARTVKRTIFGASGQHLHCGIGDSFILLDMPFLC